MIPAADALQASFQRRFPPNPVSVDADRQDGADFWDYVDIISPSFDDGGVAASSSTKRPMASLNESERDTYERLAEG